MIESCENSRQKTKMFEGEASHLSAIPALRGQSYSSRKVACFPNVTEIHSSLDNFFGGAALMIPKIDPRLDENRLTPFFLALPRFSLSETLKNIKFFKCLLGC